MNSGETIFKIPARARHVEGHVTAQDLGRRSPQGGPAPVLHGLVRTAGHEPMAARALVLYPQEYFHCQPHL